MASRKQILSIRGIGTNTPITLAVLIQEDLVPSVANEIKPLAEFIRQSAERFARDDRVPANGSLQVKQNSPTISRSGDALRAPNGSASASPYNPYVEVVEALKSLRRSHWAGARYCLVSDGLDISRGVDSSSPTQSVDLQRAVNESQRRGVAIYGFYAPTFVAAANPRWWQCAELVAAACRMRLGDGVFSGNGRAGEF
jgi:hypothetical protein